VQQADATARKLKTEDRKKVRMNAEERPVRAPAGEPLRQSAPEILRDAQSREAGLDLRDEERLKEERANSDAIFEASPVAMLILDESTNIVRVNAATLVLFGGARADFEQHRPGSAMRCVHSSKDPRGCGYSKECPLCDVRNSIEALIAGGGAMHGAEVMLALVRDGTPRKVWLEFGAEQVVLNGRRHLCVAVSDITERKRTETAVRASEERQRSLLDKLDAGVVVHAPDTSILQCNVKASVLLGLTPDQMRGKVAIDPGWRFVRDDGSTMPLPEYPVNQVVASGSPVAGQVIGVDRPAGGGRTWAIVNAYPEFDEAHALLQVVVTFVDITDRKAAADAVAASEAKYRGLFESLMDGFVLVGMDGVVLESNETYRKMLGYTASELERTTYQDVTPERWHDVEARIVAEQILPRGFSDVYEKEYRRKDGTIFPVELRTFLLKEGGRPVAMWAIVRDVTEVRALQVQLALTSRLAALGTLVAGVAHEINNPLAAALSDEDLALGAILKLRDRLRGSGPLDREAEVQHLDEVVEELGEAQEAGRRIERIVKDLKVFGRPNQRDARERVRLIDVVDMAMRWLPAAINQTATVTVENGGAPDVVATAGQITQVVVNLVTNAAKATPEGARGAIVIRVLPGAPGMARLEVVDHGIGIDPAVQAHIFDPFFTTSDIGKGTGLGLSICHAIVTSHGGALTVRSEVGKGSTFRVELPASPAEA
jgi:PAS domain S-box-containing protein